MAPGRPSGVSSNSPSYRWEVPPDGLKSAPPAIEERGLGRSPSCGKGRGGGTARRRRTRTAGHPLRPTLPLTPTRYGVLVLQPLNSTVPRAPVPPFAAVMKIPASCAAAPPGAVTVATFRQLAPSSVDSSPV
ncbi:hypothetical protein D3C57_108320 [Streptomyces rapamycinicus NRRL 5491]|uniref:Uncharacterized protein n=1 Tax=Streptomyces rapamycinicus (strain ATCC 29253 / DSM 41530 / NRRL 5491 / AYB-994) TaxID=1343740 RepID=A0A3L8RFI9_STRRN|nr:hypothetical protein D3C57_108320 [Streptomyces rapamycinicus NRRL 5491]